MKRTVALLLAGVTVMLFTACAADLDEPRSPTAPANSTSTRSIFA